MPRRYPSDLSDAEWRILQPLIPRVANPEPRATHDKRVILNAIFYIVRGGNSWRMLPHDFPKWQSVYHYFRLWRIDGTWERLHTALREQTRVKAGRHATPSAGIIDSQSMRTSAKGGSGDTTEPNA
jgi:putative transposase